MTHPAYRSAEEKRESLSEELYDTMLRATAPLPVVIRGLVAQGADPSLTLKKRQGSTVLHCAAANRHYDAVEALIACGADVNQRADDGSTALMMAARVNDAEMIRFLHALGADVSLRRDDGSTALHAAAELHQVEALDALLALIAQQPDGGKAMINHRNNKGETPLYSACQIIKAGASDYSGMARKAITRLLEAGADANLASERDTTPLMLVAQGEVPEALSLLLAHTKDVNARNRLQHSALCFAVEKGCYENVKQLLEAGADPYLRKPFGYNYLWQVVDRFNTARGSTTMEAQERAKIIRLLGEWGVDIFERDAQGASLADRVACSALPDVMKEALFDLGAPLYAAKQVPDHQVVVARRELAQSRFDATIGATPHDVASVTAQDLVLFANLGVLDVALEVKYWRGHEAHLRELIQQVPQAFMSRLLEGRTHLSDLLLQPGKTVHDWSHEVQQAPSKERA